MLRPCYAAHCPMLSSFPSTGMCRNSICHVREPLDLQRILKIFWFCYLSSKLLNSKLNSTMPKLIRQDAHWLEPVHPDQSVSPDDLACGTLIGGSPCLLIRAVFQYHHRAHERLLAGSSTFISFTKALAKIGTGHVTYVHEPPYLI
jgi:hypothetical protein